MSIEAVVSCAFGSTHPNSGSFAGAIDARSMRTLLPERVQHLHKRDQHQKTIRASSKLAWLKHFLSPAFNAASDVDRAKERYLRAAVTAVANGGELVSAMALTVCGVALALPYLGGDRFGIWLTVSSLASVLSFLDLGSGNAIISRVASLGEPGRSGQQRDAIVGGLSFLALIALLSSLGLCAAAALVPWHRIAGESSAGHIQEIKYSAVLFSGLFVFYALSSGLKKVYQGLQRAYVGHIAAIAGNLMGLGALIVATTHQAGVAMLLLATFGIPNLLAGSLLSYLLWREGFFTRMSFISITHEAKKLWPAGSMFLIMQIGVLIHSTSELLLIASLVGPGAVTLFSVSQRPFQYSLLMVRLAAAPLWAIYAEAYARREAIFIRKTAKLQMWLSLGTIVLLVVPLACVHNNVVQLWTSGRVDPPVTLTLALAGWVTVEALCTPLTTLMNGCGKLRAQVAVSIFLVVVQLPAKVCMLAFFGVVEMAWVALAIQAFSSVFFYLAIFRREIFEPLAIARVELPRALKLLRRWN